MNNNFYKPDNEINSFKNGKKKARYFKKNGKFYSNKNIKVYSKNEKKVFWKGFYKEMGSNNKKR